MLEAGNRWWSTGIDPLSAVELYLADVPVFELRALAYLFAAPVRRAHVYTLARASRAWGPRMGVVVAKDFVPVPPYPQPSYRYEGWNPQVGPAVLLAMMRPGDRLLLGEDFQTWAKDRGGIEAPSHWSKSQGGRGAGILLRQKSLRGLGKRVEEWIIPVVHARGRIWALVAGILGDLAGLIEATEKRGVQVILRVLWGFGGTTLKPSSSHVKETLRTVRSEFRRFRQVVSNVTGGLIHLGELKVEIGMISGLGEALGFWRIWEEGFPYNRKHQMIELKPRVQKVERGWSMQV